MEVISLECWFQGGFFFSSEVISYDTKVIIGDFVLDCLHCFIYLFVCLYLLLLFVLFLLLCFENQLLKIVWLYLMISYIILLLLSFVTPVSFYLFFYINWEHSSGGWWGGMTNMSNRSLTDICYIKGFKAVDTHNPLFTSSSTCNCLQCFTFNVFPAKDDQNSNQRFILEDLKSTINV